MTVRPVGTAEPRYPGAEDRARADGDGTAAVGVPGRVSVVIPCFNQASMLAEAVDSALAQTYPDVEVVVVDDGSTDGTDALVRERYGTRVVLVSQSNQGLQRARNAGIRAATGEFVMLLDSDDVLVPTAVASRMACVREGVGAVTGYYREIDVQGRILPRVPQPRTVRPGRQFYQVVRRNFGPPVGWLLRRSALEECGVFDPSLPSCDDWDVLTRIVSRYRMTYDREVGGYYRQVPGSMSRHHLVMYDTADAMLAKNATLAGSPLYYRACAALGRFQHRRRILYGCLVEGTAAERRRNVYRLVRARPALVPVAVLSAMTWVAGKRPSWTDTRHLGRSGRCTSSSPEGPAISGG